MIQGEVSSNLEAIIEVSLVSPSGDLARVEAMIDTGFSDFLTLPGEVIDRLNLAFLDTAYMVAADEIRIGMRTYEADILWDGAARTIIVHESEGLPVIGMSLVEGFRLTIDGADGGMVQLQSLSLTS